MDELEMTLYVVAAKAELDGYTTIGIGDVEKALQYIWSAYELAHGKTKKMLKRAYDAVNNGEPWKARELLEKILGKPSCQPEEF